MRDDIFREYDIRGVYNKDFDDGFGYLLGKSLCTYIFNKLGKKNMKLTVGYDARLSSPALAKSVRAGMTECGAHVIDLGLVTTPISYFSTFTVPNVDGAIMITGSHNPPEYNGFKVSFGKTTLFGAEIQELKNIIKSGAFVSGNGHEEPFDIFPSYLARYKEEFKFSSNIPVVLDCGNGAAGCILRRLFEGVGLKPQILFEEPDGRFPNHHPDPTVDKNLVALKEAVLKSGARVGIGFDGDADRIGLVDEKGKMVAGDDLLVVLSRSILKKNPGAEIIGDVKCSDRLYADIKQNGGKPIMWKTGHSLIKNKIKEIKAPFGGELSGHVFFADRNYGYDDALYAALRVVEILSTASGGFSTLMAGYPEAFNTPEIRIDTTEEKKWSIVEKLKSTYAARNDLKLNLIDGIRISFSDGWALARASNTQPVLVLRFESTSMKGLARIQSEIEAIVNPLLG